MIEYKNYVPNLNDYYRYTTNKNVVKVLEYDKYNVGEHNMNNMNNIITFTPHSLIL